MFNKIKFAQIIKKIKETYNSQEEFSKLSGIGRTYLSQYMNMKLEEPPTPKILERLAESSNNITTYQELMEVCGYALENLESKALNIYNLLEKFQLANSKENDVSFEVVFCIESFTDYLDKLHTNITNYIDSPIFISDLFNFTDIFESMEDYKYVMGFLLIYDEFLKLLQQEQFVAIFDYNFINYFKTEDLYNHLILYKNLELLSTTSQNIKILKRTNLDEYILLFSRCLTLSHLSKYNNNAIIELFKKKSQNISNDKNFDSINEVNNTSFINTKSDRTMNIPVLGKIAAGQPILAQEYLEGYLPVDPEIYGLTSDEECFYLKVAGESMNLKVKNGDYVLVKKQDTAEDGDLIVAIVNGDDEATLKRYKRLNDQFVLLEPMSSDTTIQSITIDLSNDDFKIIGKAIGQFGKF